jgi:hypothetical protein
MDLKILALAKKYTDDSIAGTGGALKGKNCTIASIEDITGGHRVTFAWESDAGEAQTETLDVMDGATGADGQTGPAGKDGKDGTNGKDGKDGAPGRGIQSVTINAQNHLIVTYTDGNTDDAGLLPVGQNGNNSYY